MNAVVSVFLWAIGYHLLWVWMWKLKCKRIESQFPEERELILPFFHYYQMFKPIHFLGIMVCFLLPFVIHDNAYFMRTMWVIVIMTFVEYMSFRTLKRAYFFKKEIHVVTFDFFSNKASAIVMPLHKIRGISKVELGEQYVGYSLSQGEQTICFRAGMTKKIREQVEAYFAEKKVKVVLKKARLSEVLKFDQ